MTFVGVSTKQTRFLKSGEQDCQARAPLSSGYFTAILQLHNTQLTYISLSH